ncbi:g2738 [Coccomyxa elongata]
MEHANGSASGCRHSTPSRNGGNHRHNQHPAVQSHPVDGVGECSGHCCKPQHPRLTAGPSSPDSVLPYAYPGLQPSPYPLHSLPPQILAQLHSGGWIYPGSPNGPAHSAPAAPPAAISVNLAPDAPEDAALVAQNLVDMQQLWDDWHGFAPRELKGEQAVNELKRLSNRTVKEAGVASQGSLNRQQMVELLQFATGVLEQAGCHNDAEYLAVLGDNLAAAPGRGGGGALFQNIQNGGRQSLTGGAQMLSSRPALHAALAAKNEAEARAKSGASAFSRAKAWVEHRGGGWVGLAVGCAVAFLGTTVLKRAAGAAVSGVPSGHGGRHGGGHGGYGRGNSAAMAREQRRHDLSERRRMQCEAANQTGREYLKELRANRFNPFWHKDPPSNSCPMPPDNLPWRPSDEMW